MSRGRYRQTFAVPVTANNYAPEVLYTRPGQSDTAFDIVDRVLALVESLPATAVILIDVLRVGGNPATSADWFNAASYSAAGLQAVLPLVNATGVRIRAKSGGTAGSAVVSAWWAEDS